MSQKAKNPLRRDGPVIMGIVNVTPDSFSDGGVFFEPDAAIARGLRLLEEGADILDVGGESTRPGASPVDPEEEQARILPVIKELAGGGAFVSVDTRHADTMQKALEAGAAMINDVTALEHDPDALTVVADAGVPVCLMHMQGTPETMQNRPAYKDVVVEVRSYLKSRIETCRSAGIDLSNIFIDPGIGFGKRLTDNLKILRNVSKLNKLGPEILIGISRKSFIRAICQDFVSLDNPVQRLPGTLAASVWCLEQGVKIFRVHDVTQTRQAFAVFNAIKYAGESENLA